MDNGGDCLITRRNRYGGRKRPVDIHCGNETGSAKKLSANTSVGWIKQSSEFDNTTEPKQKGDVSSNSCSTTLVHTEDDFSADEENAFNNSDLWLAEVNLSSLQTEEIKDDTTSPIDDALHENPNRTEEPLAHSLTLSNKSRIEECHPQEVKFRASPTPNVFPCTGEVQNHSELDLEPSLNYQDCAYSTGYLPDEPTQTSDASGTVNTFSKLEVCTPCPSSETKYTYRQPSSRIADILDFSGDANFSGDADLFEESICLDAEAETSGTAASEYRVSVQPEELQADTVGIASDLTVKVPQHQTFPLHPKSSVTVNPVSVKVSSNDIAQTSINHTVLPQQKAVQHFEADRNCKHELFINHNEINIKKDQSGVKKPFKSESPTSGGLKNSASGVSNLPIDGKAQLQTPKTTGGSSLKDRLKNRLLQNASNGTPSRNLLEELRHDSVTKAKLDASQIRREGLADGIGPFYGLPSKVQELLSANRKITKLYDWQDRCLRLPAVYEGGNLIYTLPTSGGKTLVAEILILRELLCRQRDALLILPYISIVQEKVRILSEFATELGFLVEEYAGSKGRFPPTKRRGKHSLFVATIEKGQSLVNSLVEGGRLKEVGLVVVDELHMIGEGGSRGSAMESTLLKVLNATSEPPQVIGMSATLNNIGDLAKFLKAVVFTSDFRPVSLTEYVKIEDSLYRVDNAALVPEDKLQHHKVLTFPRKEGGVQLDPDFLLPLVLEIIPDNSCLLFCPTKRYCENVAFLLAKMMSQSHRHLTEIKKDKRRALLRELQSDGGGKLCLTLKYTVHFGLAYHHSGLTTDERRLIEDAYSDGVLCLLTCTSTLAAGVNLPAKRVILRSPYVGRDFIKHSQYKQMTGRAGRAGIDSSGESILITKKADVPKVLDLLSGPQDVCHSSLMFQEGKGICSLILSLVGLKCVETTQGVYAIMQRSLLAVQATQLGIDVHEAVRGALQRLLDQGLLLQKRVASEASPPARHTILDAAEEKNGVGLEKGRPGEAVGRIPKQGDVTSAASCSPVTLFGGSSLTTSAEITRDGAPGSQQLAKLQGSSQNRTVLSREVSSLNKASGVSSASHPAESHSQGGGVGELKCTGVTVGGGGGGVGPRRRSQRLERDGANTRADAASEETFPVSSQRGGDDVICPSLGEFSLEVTELGRATFKGSVDLELSGRLYLDLKQAERSLVVANHLHLLYLVTPYDLAAAVTPSWMLYLQQLGTLDADQLKVASLVGVSESFVARKASGQSTRQKVDMAVVRRFYLTLMLHELWREFSVWDVAERFQQPRGLVQNLLSSAASFASCVLRFCQELPEFWAYQDLLGNFGQRLAYCVSLELMPLMEVPGVKLGRARQLYSAGYHTLQSLAAAQPSHLVTKIEFLTNKAARQIISAAKVILEEKTDALLEQVEQLVPLPLPPTPTAPLLQQTSGDKKAIV